MLVEPAAVIFAVAGVPPVLRTGFHRLLHGYVPITTPIARAAHDAIGFRR
jgi:hypothetical protein